MWSGLCKSNEKNSHLLLKVFRSEEEIVERHEVPFQESHQEHQVHSVCKLNTHTQVTHTSCMLATQISLTCYSSNV